jgi:hypothetical protein
MQSCRNFVKVTATPGGKILSSAEAESKEKHGVLDPMPDFTRAMVYWTLCRILLEPHLMSTPGSTPTHLPWATLCQSQP